jgi:hypothetical protein
VQSFLAKHAEKIRGVLECFDRVIIRGHLPMAATAYFGTWLRSKQIALNLRSLPEGWWNFKEAAPWFADQLKGHAQAMAAKAGRPYQHLPAHERMEANARALGQRDGIREGLVCVYSTMETCRTFRVRFHEKGPEPSPDLRVCLVIYYYFMDREFGLMHVKIQTWFPFTVQVYVNGHEWLARKLEGARVAFQKVDNAFVGLADLERARRYAHRFGRRSWVPFLHCLAARVNPLLQDWLAGQEYYWAIDQAEFSTDVLFQDRSVLTELRPHLYEHAALCFGAPQVMTFLGRKYRETFQGSVRTRWHRREPGAAVKHWIKGNALKMYDKEGVVLRIETVIQQPREFWVYRPKRKQNGREVWGWFPMNKSVTNLHRYAQVSRSANQRYLEALSGVDDPGVGQRQLEQRCSPVSYQGRRRRALQPLGRDDQALFRSVLRGEYAVRGFRNRELATPLFGQSADAGERRRHCGRVSRLIGLLRAHGLVAKVPRARRYHVTALGHRFMSTAIYVRYKFFPRELSEAA